MNKNLLRYSVKAMHSIIDPNGISYFFELLYPMFSLRRCFAKIVHIEYVDPDICIVELHPNSTWQGNQSGQYVGIGVVIDGVRHTRYYSPLNYYSPLHPHSRKYIRIAVSRHPGGIVSQYFLDHAQTGTLVSLSRAEGDFVLPEILPEKIRFFSAGSGFTAIISLLNELSERNYCGEILVIHYSSGNNIAAYHKIFSPYVSRFARIHMKFGFTQTQCSYDNNSYLCEYEKCYGRINFTHCQPLSSPNILTYACGPAGFIEEVSQLTTPECFHAETFSPPLAAVTPVIMGTDVAVTCTKSGKTIQADCGRSLLDSMLEAGLPVTHGCKMGICFQCTTTKHMGVVTNAITGTSDAEPEVKIQLCISLPESDVELDL